MKIKRFNENQQMELPHERVDEIIDELGDFLSTLESKKDYIESLIIELGNYKNLSSEGNDQIDDSIFMLELTKKDINVTIDKLNKTFSNLESYKEGGREYLYTEKK